MTDPLSLGFIGRNGAYPANEAGRRADVVLAIGARFDDRSASSWLPGYSWNFPHSKLIHVDVDHRRARPQLSARPRASWPTRAPSCARCWPSWSGARPGATMRSRHGTPTSRSGRRSGRSSRGRTSTSMPRRSAPSASSPTARRCCPTMPSSPATSASTTTGTCSSGRRAGRRPCSTRGASPAWASAPPACSAPSSRRPTGPCVAIAGDGCFTMVPHVLCTAVEYDIPVVWVIWNNFGWVSIRDIQLGMFGGRELGTMFHAGRQQDALQSRLRRLGQGQRRRCADRSPSRRTSRARWSTP